MHDPQLYFKVERLQNKVDELEARVEALEEAGRRNAQAIAYASMSIPLGGQH